MKNYILSSAIFIVVGGFLGWAVAFFTGGDTAAQSSGTGWGCAVGAGAATLYYFLTKRI